MQRNKLASDRVCVCVLLCVFLYRAKGRDVQKYLFSQTTDIWGLTLLQRLCQRKKNRWTWNEEEEEGRTRDQWKRRDVPQQTEVDVVSKHIKTAAEEKQTTVICLDYKIKILYILKMYHIKYDVVMVNIWNNPISSPSEI